MMKRSAVLLPVLLTSAAALAVTSQSSPAATSCGTVRTYYRDHGTRQYIEASSIRSRHFDCSRARYVAHRWARKTVDNDFRPARHAAGFRCRFERLGSDIGKVFCRKGSKHVSFGEYDSSPFH
jgi:hypothetical protein